MSAKLRDMITQAEQALVAKAKSDSLDDLRFQAGKIEGLKLALQLAQQNDKELNDGK